MNYDMAIIDLKKHLPKLVYLLYLRNQNLLVYTVLLIHCHYAVLFHNLLLSCVKTIQVQFLDTQCKGFVFLWYL